MIIRSELFHLKILISTYILSQRSCIAMSNALHTTEKITVRIPVRARLVVLIAKRMGMGSTVPYHSNTLLLHPPSTFIPSKGIATLSSILLQLTTGISNLTTSTSTSPNMVQLQTYTISLFKAVSPLILISFTGSTIMIWIGRMTVFRRKIRRLWSQIVLKTQKRGIEVRRYIKKLPPLLESIKTASFSIVGLCMANNWLMMTPRPSGSTATIESIKL